LWRADERTRTADLLQVRVISQALQGLARGCKYGISKPVSFLRLTACCTVLRSRWYQCGIKRLPLMHSRSLSLTSALSVLSASSECEGTPHPWIATFTGIPGMGGCATEEMDEVLGQAIYTCSLLPLGGSWGRSHSETWAGCMISFTTPTRSSLSASRSVSSLSMAEKASRVFLASYVLL
jgi:hypothetical protein